MVGGSRLGWRLGEEREIVDLGLLTQMKISKDLFLRPKSPSLFHISDQKSMVVKWWLVRWSVGGGSLDGFDVGVGCNQTNQTTTTTPQLTPLKHQTEPPNQPL